MAVDFEINAQEPISYDEDVFVLPMSFAQQRLWFLDQFEPDSPFYNIPSGVRFRGNLRLDILTRALNEIINRHETLRTTFDTVDDEPSQIVHPFRERTFPLIDITDVPPEQLNARIYNLARREAATPFNLRTGPLLRVTFIKAADDDHVILFTMHHIISDGWSMGVFVSEITALYDAFSKNRPSPLPPLDIQYGDFAEWQQEYIAGDVLEKQLDFWKSYLGGSLPILELPADKPRPTVQTMVGANAEIMVPEEIASAFKDMSRRAGVTMFMSLIAAFKVLLQRYTGLDDILVGSPIANRNRAEIEPLIGFFVNTLVLRTDLSGNPSFAELLKRIKQNTLDAYDNQDIPFERLVEVLRPQRDMAHSPLFQVMFILQNTPVNVNAEFSDVAIQQLDVDAGTSTFDLTLMVSEGEKTFNVSAEYNTDIFETSTIERLLGHYRNLLGELASTPNVPLSQIQFISHDEKTKLVDEWNDFDREYDLNTCIHQLFEAQVERSPEAIAVAFGSEYYTYEELNERANKLARYLREKGIRPDVKVSICMDKSVDLPVAVLGTLKAGGAYVPVDPTYPEDRISYMVEDSGAAVVITTEKNAAVLPTGEFTKILLDFDWPAIEKLSAENPADYPDADNLAYMIYTSGSTGKAKGTMVAHKSIVNAYLAWEEDFRLRTDVDSHLQMASFSFDVFGGDFVRALCSGGKLVLVPRETLLEADKLYALMHHERINCAEFVPAVLRNLISYLEDTGQDLSFMTNLIAGSDVWTVKEYKKFLRYCGPETRLINSFGLTEAAVDSTFFEGDVSEYAEERLVPIGRPFPNSKIYIVDEFLNLAPIGVPGELLVAGPNLARGYFKRADLTAEKFVPNLFGEPGERLYRTGDLARWLPDGNIEFLGRIDHQIKIRGFRVELGEIESVLEKHPNIKNAVVIAREDSPGDLRLVGYVTAHGSAKPDSAVLRAFLKDQVPDYMVPSAIVALDAFPLTPNGKVDRKALPAPDQSAFEAMQTFVEPRTDTEKKLANIWSKVLHVEKVGIEDNFFELGGHSLLATQVMSRIRETFDVELPLRNLFEYVTVSELAPAIDRAVRGADTEIPPITPMPEDATPVLSFAQERLWFLDQLEPNSPFYNIPDAIRIQGPLDVGRLETCIRQVVQRHDVLRTSFHKQNGKPVLHINNEIDVAVELTDLRDWEPEKREAEALRLAAEEAQKPFNLTQAPLFRIRLVHMAHDDVMLLFTMHHIISDGWSSNVMVGEIAMLYDANGDPTVLPELPLHYQDFAYWQRHWLKDEVLQRELDYWTETLSGTPDVLDLPTDRPRPAMQTSNGDFLSFELSKELTRALNAISQSKGVTLFMTLISAFYTLLSRYSGQEDINIGTPVANRTRGELESIIGFFVNTLVLRGDLSGDPTFDEFVQRIKSASLGAFAHQDVPFEKIVDALHVERNMSHSPLFQVMFALQNTPDQDIETETRLHISPVTSHSGTSKFDITLFMVEEGDLLSGGFEFNTDLFDKETIERMIAHFNRLLEEIVSDPQRRLSELPMSLPEEQDLVLNEWNGQSEPQTLSQSVVELFQSSAAEFPDNTAIEFEKNRLTFAELNARANQLAHYLVAQGAGPDTLIGLSAHRSVELVVAMLGILKAGAAYVPLDPGYPQERLEYMLNDSGVSILLTQTDVSERLPDHSAQVVNLDTDWPLIEQSGSDNPHNSIDPEQLAYMIYTSGSTGNPKGTLITHRGLTNYLDWTFRAYPLEQGRGSIVFSTIAFDATVTAVFTPLISGKTITLVPERDDLDALSEILHRQRGFSVVKITPAHLDMLSHQIKPELAKELTSSFVIGGENLTASQIEFWQQHAPDTLLFNEYGPTETVVGCVVYEAHAWKGQGSVPIGRAITNTRVYVLDQNMNPVPLGLPGELYIGGEGVARGYHHRPDLTAERFVPNPFAEQPGERLYKTGDLVRYLNDGQLIFLGRIDTQVKLRGYRIELGEIDAVLQRHPLVDAVVTLAREDVPGDKRLVSYYTVSDGAEPNEDELFELMREHLPDYMVPTALLHMDAFPLTSNGKIDRRALPKPDYSNLTSDTEFVAPRTVQEELLAGIWQELLHIDEIGIYDNFFERGGHSLLATQLMSRIRDVFQVELPLRHLFEQPNIAGLVQRIEQAQRQERGVMAPPLQPVPRDGDLPLSFAQQRLWFLDQLSPNSSNYNIPAAIKFTGKLNIDAIENAISEIVRRHEALRTIFVEERGAPKQVIQPPYPVHVEHTDLTHLSKDERDHEMYRLVTENAMQPFQLDRGPLFRTGLIRLSDNEHVLMFTMHHIISDGWSTNVLMREFAELYDAFSHNRPHQLPNLTIQYADYAAWQRDWLTDEVLDKQLSFWKDTLGTNPPVLDLPTDFPRPAMQTFNGDAVSISIPKEIAEGLHYLSQKHDATPFMTLLAAFQSLLYRYTYQDEIVMGSPIANRNYSETEALIGFFVNTLTLRSELSPHTTFEELIHQVREFTLDAYAHQDVPFEQLVDELEPERNMSRSPLFQVMFVLQNTAMGVEQHTPGFTMEVIEPDERTAKFDLTLVMAESESGYNAEFEYNTDLFKPDSIRRMAQHFWVLLRERVKHPHLKISELPLLTETEKRHILESRNASDVRFNTETCIQDLFEQRVAQTPDAPALYFEGQALTFSELNARANALAHYLRKHGVGPEQLVGISVEKSVEQVIGLLGVLKAGGVYVPIDPAYPRDRIDYILQDAEISTLLTQEHLAEQFERPDLRIFRLDSQWAELEDEPRENPVNCNVAEHLAYMIYTSGSTGKPKGTMLQHRGLVNLTLEQIKDFQLDESCRCLQFASFSFDASVSEIFTTLVSGATLYLAPKEQVLPGPDLQRYLQEYQITTITLPPTALSVMSPDGLESLRTLVSAGEACSRDIASKWSGGRRFLNAYGPTENTVCASSYPVTQSTQSPTMPIGTPIGNVRLYVLDDRMQLVPPGVSGELCIAGVGLARGYFHRPDLTAERFVPNPFGDGDRLYRTGDLVRYLSDGNIEFLGRIDHQVKLRGFRIELGEIEQALIDLPAIQNAVVLVKDVAERRGDQRLVAYIVPHDEVEASDDELRSALQHHLPDYMIPHVFMRLDEIPLTPNGKVDRRALPELTAQDLQTDVEIVEPRDETEEILLNIWKDVLGVDEIGIFHNFFHNGGHSLLATQLIARVREHFQRDVPIALIFEAPNVAQMAAALQEQSHTDLDAPPIKRVSRDQKLPLSFSQQRLWFLDHMEPGNTTFNLTESVRIHGELDVDAFREALISIVQRHEVLRTTFQQDENGLPYQVISRDATVDVKVEQMTGFPQDTKEQMVQEAVQHEIQTPFDLQAGPLLRCRLLKNEPTVHVLLLSMHHIVSDGWSMGIFVRELLSFYDDFHHNKPVELPELPLQYADFAHWQRTWLKGNVLEQEIQYWREHLDGCSATLDLPTDRPRPAVKTFHGDRLPFEFSASLNDMLTTQCQELGVTPFMMLEAAFALLLSKYSGQEDLNIGSPIANRNRTETEPLIGFFVNTLVFRNDLSGAPTFQDVVKRVKQTALQAYAHQDVPFEKLVEALQPERDLSHTPLFQVMFVYQNTPMGNGEDTSNLRIEPIEADNNHIQYDLVLNMSPGTDRLAGTLQYNVDLFDASTVQRWINHFERLLTAVLQNPHIRIDDIELLSETERRHMTVDWNTTDADFERDMCAHELFEQVATKNPDKLAIKTPQQKFTYRELDERANQLAHVLREAGVHVESRVGICLERSADMVVAFLAVLKAGGAYIPLDKSYPKERLEYMIRDSNLRLVLTTSDIRTELPQTDAEVICLDDIKSEVTKRAVTKPQVSIDPDNLAYMIYTSGSTGQPKGVMLRHRGINNLSNTQIEDFQVQPDSIVLQFASFSFDASVSEFFMVLHRGATMVLADRETLLSPASLAALIRKEHISVVTLPPSLLAVLTPDDVAPLQTIVSAGEACSKELAVRYAQGRHFVNAYGPTECTVGVSSYTVQEVPEEWTTLPIGKPYYNFKMYVVDAHLNPVPVGVHGELCIAGVGLARGYHHRPDLTAEKFVPNPFSAIPGDRMYRTGDMAYFLPDGTIQFAGRIDDQVKIRGYRIELGEIEQVLAEHPQVRDAVVLAKSVSGSKTPNHVAAYLVLEPGETLNAEELASFAAHRLPDYMVPNSFTALNEFPLTPNGKINKRALPEPEVAAPKSRTIVPPTDEIEMELVEVMQELLETSPIGITNNFFDLGGHSLLAIQLLARLSNEFNQTLTLVELFADPTVEGLARVIRTKQSGRETDTCLVRFHDKVNKPPLFMVHPSGGSVHWYTDLAKSMGDPQPVYGIQAQGMNDPEQMDRTISQMAERYVRAIQSRQRHGPYYLSSWSMGVVIAYEVAQLLNEQGEEVGMLAILDQGPDMPRDIPKDETDFLIDMFMGRLKVSRKKLKKLDYQQQLEIIMQRAQKVGLLQPNLTLEQFRNYVIMLRIQMQAWRDYDLKPYAGDLLLIKAEDRPPHIDTSEDLGWQNVVQGNVDVVTVPGNHNSILWSPHVDALVHHLKHYMKRHQGSR